MLSIYQRQSVKFYELRTINVLFMSKISDKFYDFEKIKMQLLITL